PCRAAAAPLEPLDDPAQLARVREHELLAESRARELALHLTGAVRVARLEPPVQDDVSRDAAAKAVAQREQTVHLRRGDPLERAEQPGLERHVLPGRPHLRIEMILAELEVVFTWRYHAVG